MRRVINTLKNIINYHEKFMRYEAVREVYDEYAEILNIFLIILFGNFIGLPAPPLSITLRVLPYVLDELNYFVNKASRVEDLLSDLFSTFEVG